MSKFENARVYIAGHTGLVGSAIWRVLSQAGFTNLLGRRRQELDLLNGGAVEQFFAQEKPEFVFLAAARVGGISANDRRPAEFIFENLQIQTHVIHQAWRAGVKKLLFLGSSCIYPRLAPQPIKEESLLSGPLEPTNQWYAIAKIAGVKMCQAYRRQYGCDFISAMPTNLYGPRDNFDLETSHVLPALIRRFHEGKANQSPEVVCWGSGAPLREFLYVDDLAHACLFLMRHYSDEAIINVGSGREVPIKTLAEIVQRVVGFEGRVRWDTSRPDGTPRKRVDSSRLLKMGWQPSVDLEEGIRRTYQAFLEQAGAPGENRVA